MKDLTVNSSGNSDEKTLSNLNSGLQPDLDSHENESDFLAFNKTLLYSLPYPAMYVRRKDRVIVDANEYAKQFGVHPGGYCWREFNKEKFISEEDRILVSSFPDKVPEHFKIKCSFCCSDKCFDMLPCQNETELQAHGKIWDTFWIKVSEDIFLHYFIDITDRKRLEESLRNSEQFLRQTQQIAMLGSYILDIKKEKWISSEILDTIFGIEFQPEKSIEDWVSYIHPDMREAMLDYYIKEVLKDKIRFDKEYKIIRQNDGKTIWVHGIGDLELDEKGNPVKMIGTIRDITERKTREEENSLLLACIENADDRVVVKDLNLRILAANKAWVRSRGKSNANQLLGMTDAEALDMSPDMEPVRTYMEDEKKAQKLRHGECMIIEQSHRLYGGKNSISLVKRYPIFDDKGKLIGTGSIATDITERKKIENELRRSEQRYKLLSDNITDGIFTCRKGLLEFVNKSMSRIFDCNESDLVDTKLLDLIIPERRNDFERFVSLESTSDQINSVEIECVKRDSSTIFVEMFLNYVASDNLIYGVLHDITQKRQIQERNIIKAIIQTEENERAHFSKELHDGLGPLLSTIKLYLQWSNRPKTNKSRKEIIQKAEEILEEALMTVKEISNKLSPHLLTNYGLTSAIQNFVNKLDETHALKIHFSSNLTQRLELEIEVALYRAIIECINNTVKYAKANHIHITINNLGNKIAIQYLDDGKGFDIVNTMAEKKGLGLFNLQNRIKTIGGEIMMFSKPHEGVNYHITIPIQK